MGFMYILAGLTLAAFAVISFVIRPIWRLEDALPDQPMSVEADAEIEPTSAGATELAHIRVADEESGQ